MVKKFGFEGLKLGVEKSEVEMSFNGRCTLNKDDQIRLLVSLFTVRSVLAADTKVHPNMIQNACCLRSELQIQTCILSLIHIA